MSFYIKYQLFFKSQNKKVQNINTYLHKRIGYIYIYI